MRLAWRLAAFVAVPVLGISLGVGASETVANAAVGPVQYTAKTTSTTGGAVSGYFAHALNNSVDFTHITSYVGSDGDSTLENLPASTLTNIEGGAGIGLCNQGTGAAAQLGDIYIGGGLMDVVYATGTFGTALNNGDKCENGVVNPTGANGAFAVTPPATATVSEADGPAIFTVGAGGTVPSNGNSVMLSIPGFTAASHTVTAANATARTFELGTLTAIGIGTGTFKDGAGPATSVTVTPAPAVYTVSTGTVPGDGAHGAYTGAFPGIGYVIDATATTFELAGTHNGTALGSSAATSTGSFTTGTSVGVTNAGDHFGTVLTGVPVNDTVSMDILYDAHAAYTFKGKHHAAGTVTFSATDLSANPGVSPQASVTEAGGTLFTEGDSGVVADDNTVVPLTGTAPLPDGNANLLVRYAHVSLDGNSTSGGPEVHGSLQSSTAWTAFPVAGTSNGVASGSLLLSPSVFEDDHFSEFVGGTAG
jgi:hypothetical protein